MTRPRRWLRMLGHGHDPRVRLVAVPPAGTGPAFYRSWSDRLPAGLELWAACPSGRGERVEEAPVASVTEYAAALAADISSLRGMAVALLGHSMGALVAWEAAHALVGMGARVDADLVHLFVSGHTGPARVRRGSDHRLPDGELLARLERDWGGLPEGAVADEEVRRSVAARLRHDLRIFETHPIEARSPLPIPITALGGLDDPLVTRSGLGAWREETAADFRARQFAGGHGFVTGASLPSLIRFVAYRLRL